MARIVHFGSAVSEPFTRRLAADEIWELVAQETELWRQELGKLRGIDSNDLALHIRQARVVDYHQSKLDGLTQAAMLFEEQCDKSKMRLRT